MAGVGEEVERHQRLEGGAVAALGPGPVEVGERLEAADMGGAQAALEAAAGALLLLPIDQRLDPAGGGDLPPMGQQAMQVERLGRGRRASRLLIVVVLELVIGVEPVRRDGSSRALTWAGRSTATGGAAPGAARGALERQAHRVGVRHAALERLADGGLSSAAP